MQLTRRHFLQTTLAATAASTVAAAERQNVLILFTDDQRFDTTHALGNRGIRTPNMDRLAEEDRRSAGAEGISLSAEESLIERVSGDAEPDRDNDQPDLLRRHSARYPRSQVATGDGRHRHNDCVFPDHNA